MNTSTNKTTQFRYNADGKLVKRAMNHTQSGEMADPTGTFDRVGGETGSGDKKENNTNKMMPSNPSPQQEK